MFHDYLRGSLEALLFAAGEPLSVAKLAEIMPVSYTHLDVYKRQKQDIVKKITETT